MSLANHLRSHGEALGEQKMSIVVVLVFAALEFPLLVARKLFPKTAGVLPLGGDEFSQLAILVMSGLFVALCVGWIAELFAYFQ